MQQPQTPPPSPQVSIRNSIAIRLLTLVFAVYVVITIALTAVHMAAEYYNTRETVRKDLKAMAQTFNQGLATAIYNVDDVQINSMVQGFMESPAVVGVRVSTEYQGVYSAGETFRQSPPGEEAAEGSRGDFFWHTEPIIYSEEIGQKVPMGMVTIYSSRYVVLGKVWYGFMFILVNSVIKTVACGSSSCGSAARCFRGPWPGSPPPPATSTWTTWSTCAWTWAPGAATN
jgi:hypothetical protein